MVGAAALMIHPKSPKENILTKISICSEKGENQNVYIFNEKSRNAFLEKKKRKENRIPRMFLETKVSILKLRNVYPLKILKWSLRENDKAQLARLKRVRGIDFVFTDEVWVRDDIVDPIASPNEGAAFHLVSEVDFGVRDLNLVVGWRVPLLLVPLRCEQM